MKNPQSTYFLYGYYGAGNFGDDILLSTAIENILGRDPSAKFYIRNHGPVDFLSAYGERIVPTNIEEILQSPGSVASKFLKLMSAYWTWMGKSSHLIVGGGTLIHDKPYLKSTFLLLCLVVIARMRSKKVFGIGLGTKIIKTRPGKLTVRMLIACFDRLCLRDEASYARCIALAPRARNLALTSDLAYASDWAVIPAPRSEKGTIALTLVNYMFDNGNNGGLIKILAAALAGYAEEGYDVRLIAFQRGGDGDTKILENILKNIPFDLSKKRCSLIIAEPDRKGVISAYNNVSLMIGMRFHALVFAAINGIPFLALAHEPKIDAIAKEFGMPALKLQDISQSALAAAAAAAMAQTIDRARVAQDRNLAKDNFVF